MGSPYPQGPVQQSSIHKRLWCHTCLACRLLPVIRLVRKKPLGATGALIAFLMVTAAVFAPTIARHPYDRGRLADRLQGPSSTHWLGTDEQGRDIFARIVYGARVSLLVGLGSVTVALAIASGVGLASGYWGGRLDLIVQRVIDLGMAFPSLVLLLTVVSIFPPPLQDWRVGPFTLSPAGQRGAQVVFTLGLLFSFGQSRIIRSAVLTVKNEPYIEAARALGAGDLRILARHVLPNIFAIILVLATVQLGAAILAESSLAFLGYGIPPPVPSWGQMLSGPARAYILHQPLLSVWPGLAISAAVFACNVLGDALRDVLDPRLRGR